MKEEGRLAGKKMISRNGGAKRHDGGVTVTYVINKCYLTHLIPKNVYVGIWFGVISKQRKRDMRKNCPHCRDLSGCGQINLGMGRKR